MVRRAARPDAGTVATAVLRPGRSPKPLGNGPGPVRCRRANGGGGFPEAAPASVSTAPGDDRLSARSRRAYGGGRGGAGNERNRGRNRA